jgi:hypothetical protein
MFRWSYFLRFCYRCFGALPPSLDALAADWQPVQTATYGAPSLTNLWGSALASTSNVSYRPRPLDTELRCCVLQWYRFRMTIAFAFCLPSTVQVLGFNNYILPPFSQGWNDKVDAASLYIDDTNVNASMSRWTPYSVLRNGSVLAAHGSLITVVSELRMLPNSPFMLGTLSLTTSAAPATVNVSIDFETSTRYYPRADECPSWHYPTNSYPCCWNWYDLRHFDVYRIWLFCASRLALKCSVVR